MAEKTLKARVQHKHDTQENWEKATGFVPLAGELIVYDADETHNKPRFKIGDGVSNPDTGKVEGTNVNDLPFVSDGAVINISETDVTSVVVNSETNIAGSFGFNVVEGYSEEVDNVTYGYYKVDMDLTSEEDLLKAIEDFNNAMTELETNDELTEEEKLKQRQVSMYLFKTETDSRRFDAAPVYIEAIINTNGYWQIKTQGFSSYSASEGNIKEFVSGSYIRIINYPKIGTVNVDGYSFAAGINNKALGDASFSVGRNNVSNGAYSATFGRNNTVGYNSAAYGRYNTVNGQMSTVYGQYNIVNGHNSVVNGLQNETSSQAIEAFVTGIKNKATNQAQTVVGAANAVDNDALFIVGNGVYDRSDDLEPIVRQNAFAIKENGDAEVQNDLSVNGVDVFRNPLAFNVDELPLIGNVNKIYMIDRDEYVYVSKPDSKKSEVWSGRLAEGFSKGSGSETDPYIIETAEELATAINGKVIIVSITPVIDLFSKNDDNSGFVIDYRADYGVLPAGEYTITFTGTSGTLAVSHGYEYGSGDNYELTSDNPEVTITISRSNNPDNYALGDSLDISSSSENISTSDFTIRYNDSDNIEISNTIIIGEAYFKLNNNIYLNDTNKGSWYNNNTNKPWFKGSFQQYYVKDIDGNDTEETTTFLGHIDGNGYAVYGIWYADDSNTSSLIPVAQNGTTIKNMGLDRSYIKSVEVNGQRGWAAGFVADTISGGISIENCYVGKNVYIYSTHINACAAGFIGYARTNSSTNPHVLTNCYNIMPTNHYRGQNVKRNGLIGEMYNTNVNITNCYSVAPAYQGSGSAAPKGTIENVRHYLTKDQLKTLDMGETFYNDGEYPKLPIFGYWEQISSAAAAPHIWDGSIATEFSGGDGTETAPYIIETPEQIALMVENFGGGYYYKIVNDLYFNNVNLDKSEWTNAEWYCKSKETTEDKSQKYYYENKTGILGTFNGYIDGNGHSIIGLYHKDTTHYSVGLIPTMGNGCIKNLAIKNSELNASNNIGAFIGRTARLGYLSSGVIDVENCYIDSDVIIKSIGNNGAGGIIGYTISQTLNIKNCYCLSTNIISNKAAAFVGESWNSPHTIRNCYSILQPIIQDYVARKPTSCVNVYSTVADSRFGGIWTQVSGANMQGLDVLNNTDKMPGLVGEYVITSTYPTLKSFSSESEIMGSDAYVNAITAISKIIVSSDEPVDAPEGTIWVQPL